MRFVQLWMLHQSLFSQFSDNSFGIFSPSIISCIYFIKVAGIKMSAPGYFFCRTFRHYFVGIVLHQATEDLRTDALQMKEPKKEINTLRRGGCFLCRVPGLSEDIPRPLSAS